MSLEEAKKPENLQVLLSNRRFREARSNVNENSESFKNIQQFKFDWRKYEVGTWLDVKDTIE